MYELIMRSRWIAGLFAVVTLVSVATFVGEGGNAETVGPVAEAVSDAAAPAPAAGAAAADAATPPAAADTGAPDGFTEEESLIDPASGDEDPVPVPGQAPAAAPPPAAAAAE